MAKQVNKPFLIVLTVLVIVGIVAALVIVKLKPFGGGDKPDQLLVEGNTLMTEGKVEEAIRKFGEASLMAPNRPEPLTRLGDALYVLAKNDPEYGAKAMYQWNQALQIDPAYVPALQSKMEAYIEEMNAAPRAENFERVRDTAEQLSKVDPTNSRAAAYKYIATLTAWFNNVQTDPAKVSEAIDGLKALARTEPENHELPYYVARALIQYGQDATRDRRNDEATARYSEAAALMDEAAGAQPGNVMMLLRAGQIYDLLHIIVGRERSQGKYEQACTVYFDRARAGVKPGDKNYQEVQIVYATRKLKTGDKAEAEKVYRDLLRLHPDDVGVRLVLAEILQAERATRQEAADLLAETVRAGERPDAPRTPLARMLQFRAILRLASVRMDLLEDVRDDTNRRQLLAQIESDVAKAETRMAENPETLKVRGRLLLIKGDRVKALQVLSKAAQMLEQMKANSDYDLMYSLARAHLAAQNNEEAKRLLSQIVKQIPSYMPARMLLVDLLLNSNENVEAARHIDELEKQNPNSALVARFRIFALDPKKDKKQIERYYRMLPEETRGQKLEKARIAIVIDKLTEGARLLENVRAGSPNDTIVADRLARLYIGMNQRDKAKTVIDDALSRSPNDPTLKILQGRLNHATPEDLFALANDLISSTADPLLRALQLADLERLRGNAKGMWDQLITAEKIAPNDPRVQDSLFTYYLATRQWDLAYKYIDPLAKSNFGGSYGLIYWWKFYAAKGDYDAAVRIGREFSQKMPEFAVSWVTLGQALKMKGDYAAALKAFEAARDRQSTNREAMRGAIDCLYALNRHKEAKKIIDDLTKFYPADLQLQEMALEYELKYGDPANAMKPLLGNLEREPGVLAHYLNAASMYYRMSTRPEASVESARAAMDSALSVLKRAVEHFPDQMQPYINLAEMQAIAKQRDAGEATLKAMVDHPKLKDLPEPKLILAEYYIKGNQPAQAEQSLRAALAVAPRSLEIRRKLAVFLSQTGRLEDALKVLDAAGEQSKDPTLFLSRMELLATADRYEEVEKAVTAALKDRPDDQDLLAMLSHAQFNQGKYEAAIATSDRVLAKDRSNSRALIARARAKLKRPNADPADAINDLVAYRDLNPTDAPVRILLAEVYLRKQRTADAIAEMQAAVTNAPNDAGIRGGLLEQYRLAQPPRLAEGDQLIRDAQGNDMLMANPDWLVAESTWLIMRKQLDSAVAKAQAAMALKPKEEKYIQHYLGTLLNAKQASRLLRDTDAMITADPRRWWLYQARGLARKQLSDPKAETEFARSVTLALEAKDIAGVEVAARTMARAVGPDKVLPLILPVSEQHPRYLLVAAQLYLQQGDHGSALNIVDKAMATKDTAPKDMQVAILAYSGAVYSTVKPPRPQKAADAYEQLIELQPDNVEALNQLAWILAVELSPARPEQALKYSTKAYELVNNSGRFSTAVFDTHGWVLVLCGKLNEGIELLQRVVDKYPTIEAYWHLAEGLRKQGNAAEAAAQIEKAQKLIRLNDDNKVPVDPALREKIRSAASAAAAAAP